MPCDCEPFNTCVQSCTETKIYSFVINPCPKPRQTRADRWKQRPCVMKYRAFADALRSFAKQQGYVLGDSLNITFCIEMPGSWSGKKRKEMDGKPHQQRPDLDNLVKSFQDAMLSEDSGVWNLKAEKLWGYVGQIIVREK